MLGIERLILDSLTSDPSSPANGETWYNSTIHRHKRRESGVSKVSANLDDVTGNVDGGSPDSNYGGIVPIDGGGP